jgi:hypothetical protein
MMSKPRQGGGMSIRVSSNAARARLVQAVSQLSDPIADSIGGVKIRRLPPGEALGAHDLEAWSHRPQATDQRPRRKKTRAA